MNSWFLIQMRKELNIGHIDEEGTEFIGHIDEEGTEHWSYR